MKNIIEIDKQYVANTYARFPLQLVSGKGSIATDINGKEYIDMGTGIGVTAFGYADETWANAVKLQIETLQHTSNLYYTEPCAKLAKLLCEKTGLKKVFFGNSGAEANECAIKVARKYGADKKGADYYNIITLKNSFHGRTLTTLSATGQDKFHELFNPLTNGFLYADANDIESVKTLVKENKVCGIMIECVQGEGGVLPLDEKFVKAVQEICNKEDILLIVDEVQTGNGRTGKLYSYMNFNLTPDVVTTAKGLGGGLPIGACMIGEKAENVLGFGDHGSTFGGNPVCSAGAVTVIERITDKLLNEVTEKSNYIFNELNGASGVKSVSGLGLMIGIETVKPVKEVLNYCMENGVLPLTAKTKLRLLPALNIPFKELKKAIEIIKKACAI
ncbi:MAG: aspartate aminotransferase family protein [Clostridia bacterium]|nr:aspartate aminotransferase family protein [Clostridia bacterium]